MEPAALAPVVEFAHDVAGRVGRKPVILGLCGSQGSGKSTLANALAARLENAAILSLDDLYLPRRDRERLGQDVHPLLRTRGVPGTHDVMLGLRVIDGLASGRRVALPRFDKSRDDRAPESDWPTAGPDVEWIIVEGWCVGARPQAEQALVDPVNALERDEDVDGVWRRHVNRALAGVYQDLFARLDALVLLAAPGFDAVLDWRIEQEQALRSVASTGAAGVMTDGQIQRFVAHFERLTRAILAEMPDRADLVLRLDHARRVVGTVRNA